MARLGFQSSVLILYSFLVSAQTVAAPAGQIESVVPVSVPRSFTMNLGQWDEQIRFKASLGKCAVLVCRDRVVYQFYRTHDDGTQNQSANQPPTLPGSVMPGSSMVRWMEVLTISKFFNNVSTEAVVVGNHQLANTSSFFMGNNPDKWIVDVPCFKSVTIKNLYSEVDFNLFFDEQGNLGEDFNAAARIDYSRVLMKIEGAISQSIESSGDLGLTTAWGTFTLPAPEFSFENTESKKVGQCGYVIRNDGSITIEPKTMTFAAAQTRWMSPSSFSTFIGGSDLDEASGVAVNSEMQSYVCGFTASTDFPLRDSLQTYQGDYDIFVAKIDGTGQNLVFSTYIGGEFNDRASDIEIDPAGNLVVCGWSNSGDFPLMNSLYQRSQGLDAVLLELSGDGSSLLSSSYIGGANDDYAHGISLSSDGSIFVVGNTESTDFPTVQPIYATNNGMADAFVMKVAPALNAVEFSTFVGGADWDYAYGVATISDGAWIAGTTHSGNFPIVGEYQSNQPSGDAFLVLIDATGTIVRRSTYLGGSGWDEGTDVASDSIGTAFVVGYTNSSDFPVHNEIQQDQPGWDVFVTRVDTAGVLVYSTYLGGTGGDFGYSIAVSPIGEAYLTGLSSSSDLPLPSGSSSSHGGNDAYFLCLSPDGSRINTGSYLGGTENESGYSVAATREGFGVVTGTTYSSDFAVTISNIEYQGLGDAFVARVRAFQCGDANSSAFINISDVIRVLVLVFEGAADLYTQWAGDTNCDGLVDVSDAVYLANFIFGGGQRPCESCP